MFRNYFWIILLFTINKATSQSSISIHVHSDSAYYIGIAFCNITISNYASKAILYKSVTDSAGICKLKIQNKGNYMVTAYKPGFLVRTIQFEISEINQNTKNITVLLPPDSSTLPEIVVTAKLPPVVIRGDTIIYNTNHYTAPSDDNLEDVLKRIPDFQILQNGDLKVKGRLVNKAIVNGREITNLGTAILTRSFSPEMIKNIEVRMKDSAFKESLFSKQDLVVLDIKLKKEINLPFFGRLKYSSGFQKNNLNGVYSNLFSLNKDFNFHLLAEYDQFGNSTINRGQLKNIDKEAYESIFELPANTNSFKNNEEYNNEIYGFKDYSNYQPGMIAFTGRFDLKNNIVLTIGSYNSFKKKSVDLINTQTFLLNNIVNQYKENISNNNLFTKNKLEIKIPINNKTKLELTLLFNNFIQNDGHNNRNVFEQKYYEFGVNRNQKYFTNNFLLEKIINSKISFKITGQFSSVSNYDVVNLIHNDSLYKTYLFKEPNQVIYSFNQDIISESKELYNKTYIQYDISNLQRLSIGLKYGFKKIVYSKQAYSIDKIVSSFLPTSQFTSTDNNGKSSNLSPFVQYNFSRGKFLIDIDNRLAFLKTTINNNSIFNNLKFEYNANLKFKQSDYDVIEFSWKRNVSPVVLSKQMSGLELLNFQTIAFPNIQTAIPQYENVLHLTCYTSLFAPVGISSDFSFLYGNTKYTDRIKNLNESFIGYEYNQLNANYYLLSSYFNKIFDKLPLSSKLEIDILNSNQFNVNENGIVYNTKTIMQKYCFSVFTMFDNKKYDFKLNLGYQKFTLSSDVLTDKSFQNNWTSELVTNYSFDKKKGLVRLNIKHTLLYGISKSQYTNIYIRTQYRYKRQNLFFEVDNLLNKEYFYKRAIFPLYQFDNQIKTFERYIKIGIEKKIF